MSIRAFRRFMSEAASGLAKNGLVTVASLFVVTSCLIIFGVFMAVSLNINYLGKQMANQCQIQVYVTNEAKYGGKIQDISDSIKKINNISKVEFETGTQTLADFKDGLSDSELTAFSGLPEDVISDSFKITLKDISHSEQVIEKISQYGFVKNI